MKKRWLSDFGGFGIAGLRVSWGPYNELNMGRYVHVRVGGSFLVMGRYVVAEDEGGK